jgi:hypothetical protein
LHLATSFEVGLRHGGENIDFIGRSFALMAQNIDIANREHMVVPLAKPRISAMKITGRGGLHYAACALGSRVSDIMVRHRRNLAA